MKKKSKLILFLLLAIPILVVFRSWFVFFPLSAGDWSFNFPDTLKSFTVFPYIWTWAGFAGGLGGNIAFFFGLSSFFSGSSHILNSFLGIPWVLIERLVWFWPFLIISVLSSYFIFKQLFPDNKFIFLSSVIFLFNTYILMIVGGGQMGVALAYSLVPLTFYFFFNLINKEKLKNSIIYSLILSILVMFELRIAYIALVGIFLYWILKQTENTNFKQILRSFIFVFILPGTIAVLLHSFWILPTIIYHQNPLQQLGPAYSSLDAVRFFSFAKFEDTIGLLHPNWPENIFGKVGFMRPEFLLLPILAFSSLLFINGLTSLRQKKYIIFFAILALLGSFLAKGANDPFGGIYLWMFDHIPGFMMFRDPTKWYTLVALSYSILIPFTIYKIYEVLKSRSKFSIFNFQNIFLLIIIFFLLYLIRPALLGQLKGTFKTTTAPQDYIKFEKFLLSQNNFSRTFWVPTQQRYGFYSSNHPVISAQDFFNLSNNSQIINKLRTNETETLLQESGVKYVVVPFDSQGEIFLNDRKYDNKLYELTVGDTKQIKWLKEIDGFGRIHVFEIKKTKDHFWSPSENLKINYVFTNSTEYIVKIQNAKKGDILVFSEGFDQNWKAKLTSDKNYVSSIKYNSFLNSFLLPKEGSYELKVYYQPQEWVNIGIVISLVSLFSAICALMFGNRFKKW